MESFFHSCFWSALRGCARTSIGKKSLTGDRYSHARRRQWKRGSYTTQGVFIHEQPGWREDWGGLLAAACGMKMLDNESSPYSNVHTILVRAMMAAESRESRAGIAAVAGAFAAIGQNKAASMALGRIQTDWPEKIQDSTNVRTGNCW